MRFTSSAVTTLCTPGRARAASVSMLLMRPCATVERKILPYSICGRRRLCTYSARPVTLSHDSSRGTERPTCGVSAACVARFIDGSFHVDPQQLLLVGGGAVQVAFDLQALRRLRGGQPRRPVGRGADDDGRLVAIEHDRDAERRPVVRRARRALEVGGALLPQRG